MSFPSTQQTLTLPTWCPSMPWWPVLFLPTINVPFWASNSNQSFPTDSRFKSLHYFTQGPGAYYKMKDIIGEFLLGRHQERGILLSYFNAWFSLGQSQLKVEDMIFNLNNME